MRWQLSNVRLDLTCATIFAATILLQKFGLPTGDILAVPIYVLVGALVWATMRGIAVIDSTRAVLFIALICAMMLSLVIERNMRSVLSIGEMLFIYSFFLFRIDIDRESLRKCLITFPKMMCWIALIVIAQQIIQHLWGARYWPNLDTLPETFLVPGFQYIRPVAWDSPYLVPNGVFFLEPSYLSLCLAAAIGVEIVWYRNLARLGILSAGLLSCMAMTGIADLALLSPWLLGSLDRRLTKWVLCLGIPMLVVAFAAGAFSSLTHRADELSTNHSSGYLRIVKPFEHTIELGSDPSYLLSGNSPGTSSREEGIVQWPADKFLYEYGLLTAVAFHLYLLIAVLRNSPSRLVSAVILIPHLMFGGGIVAAANVMLLMMFGSLFRVEPEPTGS